VTPFHVVRTAAFLTLALAGPDPGAAQTLSQRIATLGEGSLRLSFAARAGVCSGGGDGFTIVDPNKRAEWEGDCRNGPVRVSLRVYGGRIEDAHAYVGGHWRPAGPRAIDLGIVPSQQAAEGLLDLVERADGGTEALITAATLADSAVVWPELLRLARRTDLPLETRRHAVFWLSQAAGNAATRGLDTLAQGPDGDLEVRKQAVFALSQRPVDEGVPALIRIARTSPRPELRTTALFWLGQSDDPRALALLEEILR